MNDDAILGRAMKMRTSRPSEHRISAEGQICRGTFYGWKSSPACAFFFQVNLNEDVEYKNVV